MTPDSIDDAAKFARLWDELLDGSSPPPDADNDILAEIRWLEAAARTPAPPSDLAARTWQAITGEALPLLPYAPQTAPSSNGRYRDGGIPAPAVQIASRRKMALAAGYRYLAIGTMSGLAGGFLAGVWARVAMRVAGFLTIQQNHRLLTENDAAVGQITFGGTLFLGLLGAAAGVLAGLLYLAIRRWLPGGGWKRPLAFGGLLLAVFGFIVMDRTNPDYRLFGPSWLNVGSFSFAYIVMGFAIGSIADRLDRRIPALLDPTRSRRQTIIACMYFLPFAIIGLLGLVMLVLGTAGAGLVVILAVLCSMLPSLRPNWTLRLPGPIKQPQPFAYAVLALPSLIGVVLTLRAIVAIVGG